MQISERLKNLARMVTKNHRVADIGCDHAYTSIYLVEQGIAPKVIAMDINRGPIARAKENVAKYQYQEQIDVRLSDGLDRLQLDEVETVLISGMGGALMERILLMRPDILENVKELVLQPQSEIDRIRQMLGNKGFLITDENMLKEDGKYYVMMKAKKELDQGAEKQYELTKKEHYCYGKLLLESNHPILYEYLQKEYQQCKNIYHILMQGSTEKTILRQREILEQMSLIESGLLYYKKENN